MSHYPVPPPSYGASGSTPKPYTDHEAQEPLLGSPSRGGAGGIYDQPAQGDLPDDFKVGTPIALSRLSSNQYLLTLSMV